MKIVFYTSGITGFGRIMMGISLGNALKRNNIPCQYTMVSHSLVTGKVQGNEHIKVPIENDSQLSYENYPKSLIYATLKDLRPDILLINHLWFTPYNFIHEFDCKKIYLSDLVDDRFFSISLKNEILKFRKNDYDRVIAIEPFQSFIQMERINPLLPRNKDEIFNKEMALEKLGKDGSKKIALYGLEGSPIDNSDLRNKFSYLTDVGYEIIFPTEYGPDIYPVTDYYNALDLLIYGAGYTQFWEAIYFNKEAIFNPIKVRFSDQAYRVENCQEFYFEENGADRLVKIIMGM